MKAQYSIMVFLILSLHAVGQVIPETSRFEWEKSGLESNFQYLHSDTVNVVDFGAKGDGVTDNAPFLIEAINVLKNKGGVIYFPSGNYLIKSTIYLFSGIVLKGNSSDSTILTFDLAGQDANCFSIIATQNDSFINVLSGYKKYSDTLLIEDATDFEIGDYLEIRQENGDWDTKPADWATYSIGQVVKIKEKQENLIHLYSPLRIDYDSSLHVEVRKLNTIQGVGIECLKITRWDEGPAGNNIYMQNAVNCWIKGVESEKSSASHISLNMSSNCEITGNYIHHSYRYDGVSTHGYGATLSNHSGACLVENNIFRFLRHSISVKHGANGNVIAYNYSREPHRIESPNDAGADISFHGHYPYANLCEGNVVATIHVDQAWGPSGPNNTFFRNRSELYGFIITPGNVNSNEQTLIGNEITSFKLMYGNYMIGGKDHLLYANNFKGITMPEGTDSLPDKSYFLEFAPSYWGAGNWPSIGYPNFLNEGTIPAIQRYQFSNRKTICSSEIQSSLEEKKSFYNFKVFPNPFIDRICIQINDPKISFVDVELYSVNGKLLTFEKNFEQGASSIELIFKEKIEPGFYFLRLGNDFLKIIKY